jgi:hypothetical protein
MAAEAWFSALRVLTEFEPYAFWRLANGAAFWWLPTPTELLTDRFTHEPFCYSEIVSLAVFDRLEFGDLKAECDWSELRDRLRSVSGLEVKELENVRLPPANPPNRALQLTAAHRGQGMKD